MLIFFPFCIADLPAMIASDTILPIVNDWILYEWNPYLWEL